MGYRMLTDAMIKRLPATAKGYKRHDRDGLYIWVAPTGRKFFRSKYVRDGKERAPISLGEYPGTSLKDAREQNAEVRAQLRRGVDVATERRHVKLVHTIQVGQSLEILAREWHARQLSNWGDRHADDVIHSLEKDVFPIIGKLPVSAITPAFVWSALEPVEKRGAIETAHRIRQRLSEVFTYAIARGLLEMNPADSIKGALKPVQRGHLPAIVDLEGLRTMLQSAEARPAHPATKLGTRLLALSVVRPGVLCRARWEEFTGLDSDKPLWRIPAERMKMGEAHVVPLPREAVVVIEAVRRLKGRCPYLFPNARYADKPMSENAIGFYLNRNGGAYGRHVPHGFRSSFSSIMTERHPHDHEVIETVLAHAIGGTRGVYMRSDFNGRRRELHAEWAGLLLQGFAPPESLLEGPRCAPTLAAAQNLRRLLHQSSERDAAGRGSARARTAARHSDVSRLASPKAHRGSRLRAAQDTPDRPR
jgi:integrase